MALDSRTYSNSISDGSSVPHGIASSLAVAGLALIEPRDLSAKRRTWYRIAVASVTAWTVWSDLRSSTGPDISRGAAAAVSAGAAGTVLTLSPAGERLDAKLVDGMGRKGIPKPRRVLAAANGALMLGAWWLGRRMNRHDDWDVDSDEIIYDVPTAAVALAEHLLDAAIAGAGADLARDHGARLLREQLSTAQAVEYDVDEVGGFTSYLDFRVAEECARTVPRDYTFPISGRFEGPDGTYEVTLTVDDGHLSTLEIDRFFPEDPADGVIIVSDAELDEDDSYELEEWPTAAELTVYEQTAHGERAIA